MHNFSMLLTQKCLSMGLIDKSYSEWLSYSIEKRATTLLTWFVLCLVGFFGFGWKPTLSFATVYKGNIIKNLIMDCQSYTKYRPNETTGGIFVSWRRKEELPTGA